MVRNTTLLLGSLYLLISINYNQNIDFTQVKKAPLQRVVFKEKVVANKLTEFLTFTKAPVVYLIISKRRYSDNGRVENKWQEIGPYYKIEVARPYRDYIEKSPPPLWANWQGHLVILHIEDNLNSDSFYHIIGKTTTSNLMKFIQHILPKCPMSIVKPIKGSNGEVRDIPPPQIFDGAFWEFKVLKEKAIFLNGNHTPHGKDDIDSTGRFSGSN